MPSVPRRHRLRLRTCTALASLCLACGTLASCGGTDAAAPASVPPPVNSHAAGTATAAVESAPSEPTGDPQLTPLSDADIAFYVEVMRAAADRVRHPTPQDLDALRETRAYQAADSAAAPAAMARQQAADADANKIQAEILAAVQAGDLDKAKALGDTLRARLETYAAAQPETKLPDITTMSLAQNLTNGYADRQIVEERHLDEHRYERVASVIEEIFVPEGTAVGSCGSADCGMQPTAEELHRQKLHDAGVAVNRQRLVPYAGVIQPLQTIVRQGRQ